MVRVLIVDDDPMFCDVLRRKLIPSGHEVSAAHAVADARRQLDATRFDVVFLDVNLPDGNGLDLIPVVKAGAEAPEVIIVTGGADQDGVDLALRSGAWDYLRKGDSLGKILLALSRAVQYREEKGGSKRACALDLEGIVGASPPMKQCYSLLAQAAGTDANVLVFGETGTGKELFARAIHNNSRRSAGNFVVVDCAALPETLVESTLFGHRRGAFTGAMQDRSGLLKQADGGTLFLDEVGDLPVSIQKSFLRALQERCFTPLGGDREEKSDFRLIAATHRDLAGMVQEGSFRQDLLFRLQSFAIELPPLRDRTGDTRAIAVDYVHRACQRLGSGVKAVSPEFLDALDLYEWPGNVRELLHCLDRAAAAAADNLTLFPIHLPPQIRAAAAKRSLDSRRPRGPSAQPPSGLPSLRQVRDAAAEAAEAQYLRDLSACTGGDVRRACTISGLGRSRLYGLLKQHGISLGR